MGQSLNTRVFRTTLVGVGVGARTLAAASAYAAEAGSRPASAAYREVADPLHASSFRVVSVMMMRIDEGDTIVSHDTRVPQIGRTDAPICVHPARTDEFGGLGWGGGADPIAVHENDYMPT
jgi:hypothetical protein